MIRLAPNLSLPIDVVRRVFAILAMRGAGKTWTAAVIAEEMLKAGVPIIVIDPMGVWWGLRVGPDGKGPGLPIVVFGGEHADLPLEPDKAEKLADALMASNVSCVLDISEFSQNETQRFVVKFLDELRRKNKADRHVFLEEADVVAPQKPMHDEVLCLNAVDKFVRRGGNKNLGCTLISQRSAVVNKNVLTQSDFMIAMRTNAPQDKLAVSAWAVRRTSDKKALNEWLDSLSDLKDGEAYVWGPDMNIPGLRTKFRARETFHATRENLKRYDTTKIQPMPVPEFIDKFRRVFEGKKQKPTASATPDTQRIPNTPSTRREEIVVNRGDQEAMSSIRINPNDGAWREGPPKIPPEPKLATKQLAAFTVEVSRYESESLEGKVLFLVNKADKDMKPGEIKAAALEYGWNIAGSSLSDCLGRMVDQGLLTATLGGRYRKPVFVKVEIKQVIGA